MQKQDIHSKCPIISVKIQCCCNIQGSQNRHVRGFIGPILNLGWKHRMKVMKNLRDGDFRKTGNFRQKSGVQNIVGKILKIE